ncbi:ubiquitin-conjugating enzyme/RWD-like protein [Halenospora varia]|nr:ubiquitin-conjugating enzyme/RWD-like protein [Halenospora varia]
MATEDESESTRSVQGTEDVMAALMRTNAEAVEAMLRINAPLGKGHPSLGFIRRILRELRHNPPWEQSPSQTYVTWAPIDSNDIRKFIGSIRWAEGTLYEGGIFHLKIILGIDYPVIPSKCWFLTKVYHPNIDENGAICMDLLGQDWSPICSVPVLLQGILSMLADPNPEDPVNLEAGSLHQ